MRRASVAVTAMLAAAVFGAHGDEASPAAGGGRMTVLDGRTRYRAFLAFRTPVVSDAKGEIRTALQPVWDQRRQKEPAPLPQLQSPLPPDGWNAVDFADYGWREERTPVEVLPGRGSQAPTAMHSATKSSVIFLRSVFVVEDPAQVRDARLSLTYVGGAAVYLNGREIGRAHLPEGELKSDTLAERYPDDLYILPGNELVITAKLNPQWNQKNHKECVEAAERRYRRLDTLPIETALLRRGVNVLAIRIHRAPVNEAATKASNPPGGAMKKVEGLMAYAGLKDLTLTAAAGSAVVPNTGRRPGIQVWNCALWETLDVNSYGEAGAPLRPIEIAAVRNGTFSGRFVIGADRGVEGLKVEVSELAVAGGLARFPREAVLLRHGRRGRPAETPRKGHLFDALIPGVPERIEKTDERIVLGWRQHVDVKGAVLPVWISVRPPKDAAPGLYEGTVTVSAQELKKTVLPLRVRVHGWTLPDPVDWRVKNLNVFSPYHLAGGYKVPMWSDEHWKLIEQSFRLMAAINARRVPVDLVPGARYNTPVPLEWSMFRLVPKKDGPSAGSASSPQAGSGQAGYDYDFSTIERLFDLVAKTLQSPQPLSINCWGQEWNEKKEAGWLYSAAKVPVLDPATGKLGTIPNPGPGTEECYTFWKPILDQLRKRIDARGWFKSTAIMHETYCTAAKPMQVDIALRIWPDGAYGYTAHNGTLSAYFSGTKGGRMPVRYAECVWTSGRMEHRGYRRLLKPGRDEWIWNYTYRDRLWNDFPLSNYLGAIEDVIMSGHDGLGYLCSDFLPMENPNAKGRYYQTMADRGGTQGKNAGSLLAAGPDGPVATGRYEMVREGCQQGEAILFLERALQEKKIEGELAQRVNRYLDMRSSAWINAWKEGRSERDAQILAIAGETAEALETIEAAKH
jgi:hypothetical protein